MNEHFGCTVHRISPYWQSFTTKEKDDDERFQLALTLNGLGKPPTHGLPKSTAGEQQQNTRTNSSNLS